MTTTTTTPEGPMNATATTVPTLLANAIANGVYRDAVAAVHAKGFPCPEDVWSEYEAAAAILHDSAVAAAATARVGDSIYTPDGGPLIVAEVPAPGVVILTTDGLLAETGDWHRGTRSVPVDVYVERYESGRGRTFHGWVDAETRRMTQSG